MTVINLEQGSQAWLDWRKSKITASEIAIILGESKWSTAYELWKNKVGFSSDNKDNFAMKRGRDLEPVVRDWFNFEKDATFIPEVLNHPEIQWAAASLDGIDRLYHDGAILEIKCPGREDHETAKNGDIPAHYYSQLQWQLFVAGLEKSYYVSFLDDDYQVVQVLFDPDYIAVILPKIAEFYRCVCEMEEPEKTENDYLEIVDEEFGHYAELWKDAKRSAKEFSDREKIYKQKLIDFTDDSNSEGFGVRLTRVQRDGSIDWSLLWKDVEENFPEVAKKFDPEKYRKEQIGYWKIST